MCPGLQLNLMLYIYIYLHICIVLHFVRYSSLNKRLLSTVKNVPNLVTLQTFSNCTTAFIKFFFGLHIHDLGKLKFVDKREMALRARPAE